MFGEVPPRRALAEPLPLDTWSRRLRAGDASAEDRGSRCRCDGEWLKRNCSWPTTRRQCAGRSAEELRPGAPGDDIVSHGPGLPGRRPTCSGSPTDRPGGTGLVSWRRRRDPSTARSTRGRGPPERGAAVRGLSLLRWPVFTTRAAADPAVGGRVIFVADSQVDRARGQRIPGDARQCAEANGVHGWSRGCSSNKRPAGLDARGGDGGAAQPRAASHCAPREGVSDP